MRRQMNSISDLSFRLFGLGHGSCVPRPVTMLPDTPFALAGKEQGDRIAVYLISRMRDGRITPAEAVDVVAAQIEAQAEQMLAAGNSRDDVLAWFRALKEAVTGRLAPFLEPEQ